MSKSKIEELAEVSGSNTDKLKEILMGLDVDVNERAGLRSPLLHSMVMYKEVNNIEALLNYSPQNPDHKKYNVNVREDDGSTALADACIKGYKEIVRLLLDHGANVNIAHNSGSTPLHYAASLDDITIAKWLLEHNANPDVICKNIDPPIYSENVTPLHNAASQRNLAMIKLLVSYGADLNKKNSSFLS